jgi:dihydrofolate reductase
MLQFGATILAERAMSSDTRRSRHWRTGPADHEERPDMGEVIADLFVSLDGSAAADGVGPYFGYGGPELDQWVASELERPQTILLGRVTYEALARIAVGAADPVPRLTATPKLVVSSTLTEPLQWPNTQLLAGDAVEAVPAIKRDSELPIRTMGSLSMVRSLADAGLVDRLRLMVFPLTCGSAGSERWCDEGDVHRWTLDDTRVLDERIVLLQYRRADG